MATLFDVNVPAISKHLKNIFESGELKDDAVVSKMEITASDGKTYQTQFYNIDAVISVGYRVNSIRATQFRGSLGDRSESYQPSKCLRD